MTSWVSRRDARGRTTFVSYSPDGIKQLVPPGGPEGLYDDLRGEGLWWFGRWPRCEDTLIDFDPPQEAERVPTVMVVDLIDEYFHQDIAAIMRQQLQDAWMLCQPAPGQLADDRRTLRHASMLSALYDEMQAAFPAEDLWETQARPLQCSFDAFDELLAVPHHATATAAPFVEREVELTVIFVALFKAVWARMRGRILIGTVSVGPRACDQHAHTEPPTPEPSVAGGATANPMM